jgi:hypothetical protein
MTPPPAANLEGGARAGSHRQGRAVAVAHPRAERLVDDRVRVLDLSQARGHASLLAYLDTYHSTPLRYKHGHASQNEKYRNCTVACM